MTKDIFDGIEDNEVAEVTAVSDEIEIKVDIYSPEWADHVMTLFSEDELSDGKPLVKGLRRVAGMLFNGIRSSGPVQVFPPKDDNQIGRATVVYEVVFGNGVRYAEVADCWHDNTDDFVLVYAMASASTRAEGRALRKALNINVVSAEEITSKDTTELARESRRRNQPPTTGEVDEKRSMMSGAQSALIGRRCAAMNIDRELFFEDIIGVRDEGKLTKDDASQVIEQLNNYQNGSAAIPDEILL